MDTTDISTAAAAVAGIALTFVGLVTLGIKIMSTLKFIKDRDFEALYWQLGAWGVGIVLVLWAAHIQVINDTLIGTLALWQMDIPTQLYVGLALGSTGSFLYDRTVARDNNRVSKI